MPEKPTEDVDRLELQIAPDDKAMLVRAAELCRVSLSEFIVRVALTEASSVIESGERLNLSARGSLHMMGLLENPPEPNERLMRAAFDLPKAR
ncbi:MAG: type II toxin-antitoxin system TacA family antitoxin [Pseudohaliea sp.]